jgi:hypothetical protein
MDGHQACILPQNKPTVPATIRTFCPQGFAAMDCKQWSGTGRPEQETAESSQAKVTCNKEG